MPNICRKTLENKQNYKLRQTFLKYKCSAMGLATELIKTSGRRLNTVDSLYDKNEGTLKICLAQQVFSLSDQSIKLGISQLLLQ